MPFCKFCGKNLNDGENCTCNDSVKDQDINSSVSEDSAILNTVKKSVPYLEDVFNLFRRTISKNTVKEVSSSAKRNSILWIFIVLFESIINALAITVVARRAIYSVSNSLYKSFSSSGISYGDFSKTLKEVGLGFFNLFSRTFLIGIICFFITVGLIYILLKICRKTFVFNNIGNMVSTAAIPLTVLSIINILLCFILPVVTLLIYFVAVIAVSLLMYFGIQKIDKFNESPFWIYMALVLVILIAYFLVTKLLMPEINLSGIFSSIFY